jgi:ribonuclease T2
MALFARGLCAVVLLALAGLPARAEVPAEGRFVASKACPALQSIRKETNPGNVTTAPGTAYAIIAKNRKTPT